MNHSSLALAMAAEQLRDALGDRVVLPADPAYDTVRGAWNLTVDQRPAAVVLPTSAEDVVDAVRAATAAGLRIAPQSTGHAAGALSGTDLADGVLLSLASLRGVTVDAATATARVLGGSVWNDVLAESVPLGFTAPHGSAGDVSVVGYSLSGGLSFVARAHGLAANHVRAVHIVTADGVLVTASAEENPELFWAVRGGSGAFGVVVSMEIDLLPYPDVFAGMMLWDAARAASIVDAWAEWTEVMPESVTTTLRVMSFPPLPELPPFLSGRSVVVLDGAILESDQRAQALLAPMRAFEPEMDTFARIPSDALVHVHMDPPQPTPAVTTHATLTGLPPAARAAFVAAAESARPLAAELRHLGGAAARRPAHGGAVAAIDADYLVAGIAVAPVPEALGVAWAAANLIVDALQPWHGAATALTFIDAPDADHRGGFGESADRLAVLKREYDPRGVFAAAHPVD